MARRTVNTFVPDESASAAAVAEQGVVAVRTPVVPLELLITAVCGWLREQADLIAFPREVNRVLEAGLRGRQLRLYSRLVSGWEVLLRRDPRRTFEIPVPAGQALPDLSVGGITDLKRAVALPGVRIEEGLIWVH